MATPKIDPATVEKRSLALATHAALLCHEKRATDIMLLDLRSVCGYTDFFVIATSTSAPQMKGISREVEKAMKEQKAHLLSREGIGVGGWSLLDYGDVVVHLFDEATREFYQLEHLWGDAKVVDWRGSH